MPIQAIAFDLDGTLVDSIQDLARAANLARADLGFTPLQTERVVNFVGDGAPTLIARVLADDRSAVYTNTDLQAKGMALFETHYQGGLTKNTTFYPTVQATLHQLHQRGIPLAIITNKPERFTIPLLRELGVAEHFDLVLGGDSLATKKPSAEPLQFAASHFGIQPANLLMVGDSENDILAARAAGSPVIAVSYGYGHDVDSLQADAVIDSFAQLSALIDRF